VLCVGNRILSIGDIPKDQLYPLKYPLRDSVVYLIAAAQFLSVLSHC